MHRFCLPFLLSIHPLGIRFSKHLFPIIRPRILNWIFLMLILVSFLFSYSLELLCCSHIKSKISPASSCRSAFLLVEVFSSTLWRLFDIHCHIPAWNAFKQARRELGSVSLSCPRNTILQADIYHINFQCYFLTKLVCIFIFFLPFGIHF